MGKAPYNVLFRRGCKLLYQLMLIRGIRQLRLAVNVPSGIHHREREEWLLIKSISPKCYMSKVLEDWIQSLVMVRIRLLKSRVRDLAESLRRGSRWVWWMGNGGNDPGLLHSHRKGARSISPSRNQSAMDHKGT